MLLQAEEMNLYKASSGLILLIQTDQAEQGNNAPDRRIHVALIFSMTEPGLFMCTYWAVVEWLFDIIYTDYLLSTPTGANFLSGPEHNLKYHPILLKLHQSFHWVAFPAISA